LGIVAVAGEEAEHVFHFPAFVERHQTSEHGAIWSARSMLVSALPCNRESGNYRQGVVGGCAAGDQEADLARIGISYADQRCLAFHPTVNVENRVKIVIYSRFVTDSR
jgi:hypothetical protein